MHARTKSTLINLTLLCGTIVLFFGGLEIALRVTGIQTTKPNPPRIYQRSVIPDISYELIPNHSARAYRSRVTTNRLGFRGPELVPGKPVLAVLGDSITFGYGLEDDETISARLSTALPEWNVVNAGVPGYNLLQQTAVYREKLRSLAPEALILIFHFNDVEEVGLEIGQLDDEGILRPAGWTPTEEQCTPIMRGILAYLPGKCWLDLHSALYRAMERFLNLQQGKRDLRRQEEEAHENPSAETITDDAISAYGRALSELTPMLPRSLPRLFVIWPERHLHAVARPKIRKLAEQRGFIVLDLYDTFGNRAETLGWDTVHPSAATAAKGAEVVRNTLVAEGLLESK